MAERIRSKDGHSETKDVFGPEGATDAAGREGGRLARQVASKDELKRATERPAGATRVTKSMEEKDDDETA